MEKINNKIDLEEKIIMLKNRLNYIHGVLSSENIDKRNILKFDSDDNNIIIAFNDEQLLEEIQRQKNIIRLKAIQIMENCYNSPKYLLLLNELEKVLSEISNLRESHLKLFFKLDDETKTSKKVKYLFLNRKERCKYKENLLQLKEQLKKLELAISEKKLIQNYIEDNIHDYCNCYCENNDELKKLKLKYDMLENIYKEKFQKRKQS